MKNSNRPPSPLQMTLQTKGITLVELMIVVAIVGVLGSFAVVSYSNYITQGKVTEMKQYAMDVVRGQEQYFARNNEYFEPSSNYTFASFNSDAEWNQLLEFNPAIGQEVTIEVETGAGGDGCNICVGYGLPSGIADDTEWYAVLIHRSDLDRRVFIHNELPRPIEVGVGGESLTVMDDAPAMM